MKPSDFSNFPQSLPQKEDEMEQMLRDTIVENLKLRKKLEEYEKSNSDMKNSHKKLENKVMTFNLELMNLKRTVSNLYQSNIGGFDKVLKMFDTISGSSEEFEVQLPTQEPFIDESQRQHREWTPQVFVAPPKSSELVKRRKLLPLHQAKLPFPKIREPENTCENSEIKIELEEELSEPTSCKKFKPLRSSTKLQDVNSDLNNKRKTAIHAESSKALLLSPLNVNNRAKDLNKVLRISSDDNILLPGASKESEKASVSTSKESGFWKPVVVLERIDILNTYINKPAT